MKKVLLFATMIILLVLVACTSKKDTIEVAKEKRMELNLAQKINILSKTNVPDMDDFKAGMSLEADFDLFLKSVDAFDHEQINYMLDAKVDASIEGYVKLGSDTKNNHILLYMNNLALELETLGLAENELIPSEINISYHMKNSFMYITSQQAYLRVFTNVKQTVNNEINETKIKFDQRLDNAEYINGAFEGVTTLLEEIFKEKETNISDLFDLGQLVEDVKFINDAITVYEVAKSHYVVNLLVDAKLITNSFDKQLENEELTDLEIEELTKIKKAFQNFKFDLRIEIIDKKINKVSLETKGKIEYIDSVFQFNLDITEFKFSFVVGQEAPKFPRQGLIDGFKLVEEFSEIS